MNRNKIIGTIIGKTLGYAVQGLFILKLLMQLIQEV